MLTLAEQYVIDEFKVSDFWKKNTERGDRWAKNSYRKNVGKSIQKGMKKSGSGSVNTDLRAGIKRANDDYEKNSKKADRWGKVGDHAGQIAGAGIVAGAAGGAFLAYKMYKKWRAKQQAADTPEEKELFRKKAEAAKSKAKKLKTKKA
jgi:hypothetical protein